MKQYYNISIYCNIYYSNTIEYGLKEISVYCTLRYIAIYCNVCCLNVVNAQSLHHKNDWTSRNLGYKLEFLNQARAGRRPACAWFPSIDPVRTSVCVCVFVCVSAPEAINN